MMSISRRYFLKVPGGVVAGLGIPGRGNAATETKQVRIKGLKTTATVCCFCAVGCGAIVNVNNGKVVNIKGDLQHPINQGSLCSKGAALSEILNSEERLKKVKYRAPGS